MALPVVLFHALQHGTVQPAAPIMVRASCVPWASIQPGEHPLAPPASRGTIAAVATAPCAQQGATNPVQGLGLA